MHHAHVNVVRTGAHLGVPLQVLRLRLSVFHVQHILVAGVVVRAEQLGQGVVELCWKRASCHCGFGLIKPCKVARTLLNLTVWQQCYLILVKINENTAK